MKEDSEELLEEVIILEMMIRENPCRMKGSLLSSLADSVRGLFNRYIVNDASREDVARYFGVDVRTITRWRNEYDDFPIPRHNGHREISYCWKDVIGWKMKHKEASPQPSPVGGSTIRSRG